MRTHPYNFLTLHASSSDLNLLFLVLFPVFISLFLRYRHSPPKFPTDISLSNDYFFHLNPQLFSFFQLFFVAFYDFIVQYPGIPVNVSFFFLCFQHLRLCFFYISNTLIL